MLAAGELGGRYLVADPQVRRNLCSVIDGPDYGRQWEYVFRIGTNVVHREVLGGDDDARRLAQSLSDNNAVPWISRVDASGNERRLYD